MISNITDFKQIIESDVFCDVESKKEQLRKTDFKGITLIQAEMDHFKEKKVVPIPKKTKMVSTFESKAKLSGGKRDEKKAPFVQVHKTEDAIKEEDKLEPNQSQKLSIFKPCDKRKISIEHKRDMNPKLAKLTQKVKEADLNVQKDSSELKTSSFKPDLHQKAQNLVKKKEIPSDDIEENKISLNCMVWPMDCPKCHRQIVSLENFGDHLRQHWWIDKCCAICGKKVNSKLDHHLKSHTRANPFNCHLCKFTFDKSFNLRMHLLKHKKS